MDFVRSYCFHSCRDIHSVGSLSKDDVDDSENVFWNVTLRFCNHFSIIQTHYAWKMCSNYPGIKLEPALGT